MLRTVKRWMSRAPLPAAWGEVPAWASREGYGFRRERDDRGFVIDGVFAGRPWRLEWGPPQRDYLVHPELRLRCELGASERLHMLAISSPLADALERLVFERFTEATRTEADLDMPEEARWVTMYPALDLQPWRVLRHRLRVLGPEEPPLRAWLASGLATELAAALDEGPLRDPQVLEPVVVMTLRGRLYVRTALAAPDPGAIALTLSVARAAIEGAAAAEAALAPEDGADSLEATVAQGTTAWQRPQRPE